jgi:tRNA (guanine37-N1)-methyltransferase
MPTLNFLTLFPEFFTIPLQTSILKKAQAENKVNFNIINIRDFAQDKHQVTDEPPYGGGAGMVMKIEPIDLALKSLNLKKGQKNKAIVLTSAKGEIFTQQTAITFSQLKEITIICGHYEGVDERVAQHLVDYELRIGDYVLTGGEPAALVMADAITRLVPGVLGNPESLVNESHSGPNQKAAPQYTRPEIYQGWQVPKVLLSGDHEKIKQWREKKTLA